MEKLLSAESAAKLQKILSKRLGRKLTDQELDLAYSNLMEFTYALLSLNDDNDTSCIAKN